ncbi:MAG: ATP-binding cassette domain-containing protein [Candidatus Thermoplasmatota archaeon]|nr:ATP-binding cassette domain-containing protein [Candidatus Thermoplasmatota archaeon]
MRALEFNDVSFTYKGSGSKALEGVSFAVNKGEFITLLGRNGSGKSTICLMSNGLIPHALPGALEGAVRIFGQEVRERSVAEFSKSVGIVFQEPESQLFCMSVEEEVAFGPENLAVPREEIGDRVEWALELVGMKGFNDRSPFSLSGGEKQRVAIAAALSMRPEMLVLDEPAYALDPVGRFELYSVLKELKQKHGMTVVLAERDPEEAVAFSDRLLLLEDGKIAGVGATRNVLRDPQKLSSLGIAPPQLSELAALLNSRLPGESFSFLSVEEAERTLSEDFFAQGRARRA